MRKQLLSVLLVGLLPGLLSACVTHAETVAEHFDRQMSAFAKDCAKTTPRSGSTSCDRLKLKPADPLATEEGRFAHSIKIPNPVAADSGYKPGMTSEQYFDHLCKTEAGEFIFKTLENIEGIYLMRPREKGNDYILQDLHAMEDPYAYSDVESEAPEQVFINPPWRNYKYFEIASTENDGSKTAGAKYRRYFGYIQDKSPMKAEAVVLLKSRYGYTWRGIKRPHDREFGIVGGELIVMDLQSNEVLAVRRGFIRSGDVKNNLTGIWWIGGYTCPKSRDKHISTYEFISKVLKPSLSTGSEGGSSVAK